MVKIISSLTDDARKGIMHTVQRRTEEKAILTKKELVITSRNMLIQSLVVIVIITLIHHHVLSLDTDTIDSSTVLTDPDSIDSSNKQFSLGFFSPNGTTNRYLGIWYYVSPQTITWVANRGNPLKDSSGSVSISSDGNLVLTNGKKEIFWSSNITPDSNTNRAQISNTGNLVLIDGSSKNVLWESHKHPVDTLLPSMRVSQNPRTGERLSLDSWKSFKDPSPGNFTCGLQAHGIPQIYIWENENGLIVPRWRSGPWNGRILTGVIDQFPMYVNGFNVETSDDGTVYFGKSLQEKFLTRNYLNSDGLLVEAVWDVQSRDWNVTWSAPRDECDFYNKCGPFAVCFSEDKPVCSCLKGYEPKNRDEWGNGIWRSGCTRRTSLQCERESNATDKNRADGFSRLSFVKVPDFMVWIDGLEYQCQSLCLKNCSCLAYGYDPGIGCMYWSGELIDIQKFDGNAGTDLYVRVAYSEIDKVKKKKSNVAVIAASVTSCFASAFICLFLFCMIMRKRRDQSVDLAAEKRGWDYNSNEIMHRGGLDGVHIEELPLFSYGKLANATNNFDIANKLGMGGFGPVYKGKLENGKEIAVKRLSAVSGQGVEEFMNEVVVISKLQHRNLVRLLGCCVEKGEKILVYEYLPNKSLDVVLFDSKQEVLDWKKRFDIIEAIGRGLLYLHRDSRLKIIHRDLKPSNILLDEIWTPKISDFGMARIFGGNQDQANTAKVVGTYGYMAPEYAVWGRFSEKSDVFSFGVLLLEIVSGKRNTRFYNDELSLGLLGYAWKLWNEKGDFEDFIDARILSSGNTKEIVRCINIGLLCVQESPHKRPSISTVVSMLISEIVELPKPEHPGFTDTVSSSLMVESSSSSQNRSSNKITLTVLEGR